MNTGMLWFDNDPKTTLAIKIERAVEYYHKKYGCKPNLCLIHPAALENPAKEGGAGETLGKDKTVSPVTNGNGVTIRPYRPVLPGHLWIGVEENH